jgi:hypothetical protein
MGEDVKVKFVKLGIIATVVGTALTGCGGSSDSYGAACPILNINSTKMAILISSVPTAADEATRRASVERALGTIGETDLNQFRLKFNSDLNTVLSGVIEPPTGSKFELVEKLRSDVWNWSWREVSDSAEVLAIMAGFADIDTACNS